MITLTGIYKQYGDQILYKNCSFQIKPGEKTGLVGPNGAGKSTIFKIIMKEEGIDSGELSVPEKTSIAYFSQNVGEMKGRSVLEEVKSALAKVDDLNNLLRSIEKKLEDPNLDPDEMMVLLEKMGEAQEEFDKLDGYNVEPRAKAIITGLGIDPEDHHRPVESFSGGWKMRIALAKVLLMNPDVLLIDEPTNHLDLESILWLEQWMKDFKGAIVMTSHDRDFMNSIVNRIVEISHSNITTYSGNYEYYLKEKEIRKEQLVAQFEKQQSTLAKEEEFIAKFAARASHAAQVQSRVKKLDKIERVELPKEEFTINFEFPTPVRSGNDVVAMENLGKTWLKDDGSPKKVFSNLTGMVRRLDKIAVVGVNGAGKSTLLKIIAGMTEASEGKCTVGASVNVGYFSQHSIEVLHPGNTVFDEVQSRVPLMGTGSIRNLLGAFLFSGDDVFKKISVLSGGEKSRVVLATLLCKNLNFLILDEPTNHLDIKSREILLDAIKKFDGTVMLVSHDRHFAREIANRVFEVDKGQLNFYNGTYDEYLEQKVKEASQKSLA
ncbi:MAG: ABC-F family ATP-binding cassette domain-containing protein [Bacteriovoracaceae bacterium]